MKRVPFFGFKGDDKGTPTLKKGKKGRLWVRVAHTLHGKGGGGAGAKANHSAALHVVVHRLNSPYRTLMKVILL